MFFFVRVRNVLLFVLLMGSLFDSRVYATDRESAVEVEQDQYYNQQSLEELPTLSLEETNYIEERNSVIVGVLSSKIPYSSMEEESQRMIGIHKELLEILGRKSGLEFSYIALEESESQIEALKERVDLVIGLENTPELLLDKELAVSDSYLKSSFAAVGREGANLLKRTDIKIATTQSYREIKDYLAYAVGDCQTVSYDSVLECVEAVRRGEADFVLDEYYVLRYLIQKPIYEQFKLFPLNYLEMEEVIVTLKEDNNELISIINKTLRTIDSETKNQIVASQIAQQVYPMKLGDLLYHYRIEFYTFMTVFIIGIGMLLILLQIRKKSIIQIKEKNSQLHVKQYLYEIVLGKTQDIIFEWDYESKTIYFSKNHEKIAGDTDTVLFFPNSVIGTDYIHNEDEEILNSIFNEQKEKEYKARELRFQNAQGGYQWYSIDYSKLYDDRGKILKVVGMISNIEKEKQKLLEVQNQAMRDSMTTLYNRRTTEELIDAHIKKEENKFGIMIILDIDNFKIVNDTKGHAKGDEVVIKMAEILKAFFRKDDIIGRLGGDEFLVFLTNLSTDYNVKKRATELLELMNKTFQETNDLDCISCSLGISSYPDSGVNFQELYEAADLLLYEAKKQGKNTYVAWKD